MEWYAHFSDGSPSHEKASEGGFVRYAERKDVIKIRNRSKKVFLSTVDREIVPEPVGFVPLGVNVQG